MEYMETIETIANQAGITKAALYHRMRKLGIKPVHGLKDKDAKALLDYRGEKPGRKTVGQS